MFSNIQHPNINKRATQEGRTEGGVDPRRIRPRSALKKAFDYVWNITRRSRGWLSVPQGINAEPAHL